MSVFTHTLMTLSCIFIQVLITVRRLLYVWRRASTKLATGCPQTDWNSSAHGISSLKLTVWHCCFHCQRFSCQYPPRRHLNLSSSIKNWRSLTTSDALSSWSLSLLAKAASLNQTYSDNRDNHSLVNALVIIRIDYCNAVLTDVHDSVLATTPSSQCSGKTDRPQEEVRQHNKYTTWRPALVADSTTCRLQARCTHVQLHAQLVSRLLDYHVSRSIRDSWSSQSTLSGAARQDLMVPATRTVRYGPRSFAVGTVNMELLANVTPESTTVSHFIPSTSEDRTLLQSTQY